jgi:membrane protease subunit HflC
MKRRVLFAVVLLGALLLWGSAFAVPETEYVLVTRFGDPRRVIETPGLHFKWPAPIDQTIRIDRRTRVLDPEAGEFLTSDKKNVLVDCFLVWKVADPRRFLVSVTDRRGAEARLTDMLRSEVGGVIGSHPLSRLVSIGSETPGIRSVNEEISRRVAARTGDGLGIEIASVRIKRLNFPRQNKEAVFARMAAERHRIAKQYRSEGEEEAEKLRIKADRERADLLNEAKRVAEETRGQADAEATRAYAAAYGEAP